MTPLKQQALSNDPEVQVDQTLLAEVQEVVQELSKTIKIFRTYPRSNNMSITSIDKLVEVFGGYLESHRGLELFVERHEIRWQEIPVYSDDDQRRSFALKLDRDGVRRVVFTQGLDREQMVGFLEALATEIDEESLDDDLVTLLWDKQLANIKLFVLDDMSSGQAFDAAMVEADQSLADAPSEGASAGSTSTPGPGRDSQGDPMAQRALCTAAKAKIHPVTEDQAEQLKVTATREESVDVASDLQDVLFDLLVVETEEEISTNAVKVLVEIGMMYVRQAEFKAASQILERLRSLAVDEEVEHDIRARVVEQLQSLGEPRRVQVLHETLRENPNVSLSDLARFLQILPAPAAPGLCELMDIERCDKVIRTAIAHLVQDDPTVLTARLAGLDVGIACKVLEILEQVGDVSLGPSLVDPLTSAEPAVQLASVKLLGKIKGDRAKELLLHYVAGDDAGLRRHALAVLGGFEAGNGPATVLRQQAMSSDFHNRTLQEKKNLLVTLARLEARHAVGFLGAILTHRKWFEKTPHAESRACAALALGEVADDAAARTLLEKHVSDKQETVRTAVKVALSRAPDTVTVET